MVEKVGASHSEWKAKKDTAWWRILYGRVKRQLLQSRKRKATEILFRLYKCKDKCSGTPERKRSGLASDKVSSIDTSKKPMEAMGIFSGLEKSVIIEVLIQLDVHDTVWLSLAPNQMR